MKPTREELIKDAVRFSQNVDWGNMTGYEIMADFAMKAIAEHEAKINKMLKHPNVLTVLRFGVKSPSRCGLDDCYGVMELYDYARNLPAPYQPQEGGEE